MALRLWRSIGRGTRALVNPRAYAGTKEFHK